MWAQVQVGGECSWAPGCQWKGLACLAQSRLGYTEKECHVIVQEMLWGAYHVPGSLPSSEDPSGKNRCTPAGTVA